MFYSCRKSVHDAGRAGPIPAPAVGSGHPDDAEQAPQTFGRRHRDAPHLAPHQRERAAGRVATAGQTGRRLRFRVEADGGVRGGPAADGEREHAANGHGLRTVHGRFLWSEHGPRAGVLR